MKSRIARITAILLTGFVLMGCSNTQNSISGEAEEKEDSSNDVAANSEKTTIKIGTTQAWEPRIAYLPEKMKPLGYEIEIQVFDDVTTPNLACTQGELDMVVCQNIPYMEAFNESYKEEPDLVACEPLLFYDSMALITDKYTSVNDIPKGAKIGICDDVANLHRTMQCLEIMGYVELNEIEDSDVYTLDDIISNSKELEFIPMDWTALFTSLPDLDGIIMTVSAAYMKPEYNILDSTYEYVAEDTDSPERYYSSNAAVVEGNENTQWCKDVMENICGDELKEILEEDNKAYGNAKLILY